MDPIEKLERKREAERRLLAQRRRASLLRTRVVAIALIGFVLFWAAVFAQMATGNDPVLSAAPAATRSGSAAAHEAIETTAPEELETEAEPLAPIEEEPVEAEPELEEPEPEPEPAPVITSQS